MKTCIIKGCFRRVFTHGHCDKHKGLYYAEKEKEKQFTQKIVLRYSDRDIDNLLEIAKRHVHKFVRERDKLPGDMFYCPACDKEKKIDGNNYHACHLFPAGTHSWLRFDPDNIHGGCLACNYYKHGAGYDFSPYVIKKIGQERYDKLINLNAYYRQNDFHWDRFMIIEIIEKYKSLNKIAA